MRAWWCVMVVVMVCVVVPGEGQGQQQQQQERDWGACGPVVCGEVERQAQSLARLKLLRTYITQSAELLQSMVGSLDVEVARAAQSLTEFTGDECESAQPYLLRLSQHESEEYNNFPRLEVLDGSDEEDYYTDSTLQASTTSQIHSTSSHVSNSIESDDESGTQLYQTQTPTGPHTTLGSTQSQGTTSTSTSRLTNKLDVSASMPTTTHSGEEDEDDYDDVDDDTARGTGQQQGPYQPPTNPTWRPYGNGGSGGTGYGYGGGSHGYGGGGGAWRGHGGGGRKPVQGRGDRGNPHHNPHHHNQHHHSPHRRPVASDRRDHFGSGAFGGGAGGFLNLGGHGILGSVGGLVSGRQPVGCRAMKGTPFWVPGLDDWCAANCAVGNCPQDSNCLLAVQCTVHGKSKERYGQLTYY